MIGSFPATKGSQQHSHLEQHKESQEHSSFPATQDEANNTDQTKKIHSNSFGEAYNKYQYKKKLNVQSCLNIQDLFLHQIKKVANSSSTRHLHQIPT